MVSIPACHAGDRGSIPRLGVFFSQINKIRIFFVDVVDEINKLEFLFYLFQMTTLKNVQILIIGKNSFRKVKIILLGIISIVCIARAIS